MLQLPLATNPVAAPRRGRTPGYSAKRGQAVYSANRTHSHKPHKLKYCGTFVAKEALVLTLINKKTENDLAIQIPGKLSDLA